jgi:cytochrome P450
MHELEERPYDLLARLRAEAPVAWLPALEGWLVTGRDAAVRVMRDAATFTVDDPRFSTARVIGPSMLSLDGAEHARQRDPFAYRFRPAETRRRFTGFVAEEVARLVEGLRPRGEAELRAEFAGPLAVAVAARALDLTGLEAGEVRTWYEAFVTAISDLTAGREPATDAHRRAYRKLREAVGEASYGDLGVEEVTANLAVLLFGGIDTTEGMVVNLVMHLLTNPDQLALVRDDPALLDAAVEESLRLEPAASVVDRYATADVRLEGAPIRAGDLVRVSLTATGRDPARFPDPDRFEVKRANAGEHLAFAHGPHFCLGAHLARLETRTAVRALLGLPGLRLAPGPAPAPRGLVFRKPPALQVRWNT